MHQRSAAGAGNRGEGTDSGAPDERLVGALPEERADEELVAHAGEVESSESSQLLREDVADDRRHACCDRLRSRSDPSEQQQQQQQEQQQQHEQQEKQEDRLVDLGEERPSPEEREVGNEPRTQETAARSLRVRVGVDRIASGIGGGHAC